jgi:hypothetical protein
MLKLGILLSGGGNFFEFQKIFQKFFLVFLKNTINIFTINPPNYNPKMLKTGDMIIYNQNDFFYYHIIIILKFLYNFIIIKKLLKLGEIVKNGGLCIIKLFILF